jgi:hypothetical protein
VYYEVSSSIAGKISKKDYMVVTFSRRRRNKNFIGRLKTSMEGTWYEKLSEIDG